MLTGYDGIKARCALKCVKHSAFATQETYCYQANLYFDGSKIATVGNDGHGGCDYELIVPNKKREWTRLADLVKALPVRTIKNSGGDDFVLHYSIEDICGDLLSAWLLDKDIKRIMKKDRVVFIDTGGKQNEVCYYRHSGLEGAVSRTVDRILQDHPGVIILTGNSIDFIREVWPQ